MHKKLFKTADVIRFLYNYDCVSTADSIKKIADSAEFIDSKTVEKNLIKDLYQHLKETLNQYTYAK